MKSRILQITADQIANQVSDVDAPALDPADCRQLPIVECVGSRIEIIDGFHRLAGMLAFGATTMDVVTCDDEMLLGDAANAEDTATQRRAFDAIYAAL